MTRLLAFPLLLLVALWPVTPKAFVAQDKPGQETLELKDCLVLPSVGAGSRSPVHTDALEARMLEGKFVAPVAGEKLKRPGPRPGTVE